MKATKFALVALAALAVLGAAGVTYLALTFDPLDHTPRLIELVKNKTGRTLDLNGRVELSYWPELSVRIGGMSLSEPASDAPFAEIESARLNVRFVPLLSRRLVVNEIIVSGAHMRVTRFADGRFNIDDLISGEGGGLAFDIGRIKLENSALTYRDLVKEKVYEFSAVQLESGRLSPAHNTPLSLAFRAVDAGAAFDVAAQLKARYTFDGASRRYALDDVTLHLTGIALGLTQLAVQAEGNFGVIGPSHDLHAAKPAMTLKGVWNGGTVDAVLAGDSVAVIEGKMRADALRAEIRSRSAAGTAKLNLAMPNLQYADQTWTGADVKMNINFARGGRVMDATVASPLAIDLKQQTWRMPQLQARFSVRGSGLPATGVDGLLEGHAEVALANQSGQGRVAGRIGSSQVKALITSSGFAAPLYNFAVDVDQLDLDRYIVADLPRASQVDQTNLSTIAELPVTGTLKIGMLKTSGVRANNVRLVIKP